MLTAKDPSLTGQSKSGQSSSSARTAPRRRSSPRINFMISPQTGSPLCVAFNLDHRRLIDLVLHNPCPSPCPGPSGLSAAISPPVFVLIWGGALPQASKGHLPQPAQTQLGTTWISIESRLLVSLVTAEGCSRWARLRCDRELVEPPSTLPQSPPPTTSTFTIAIQQFIWLINRESLHSFLLKVFIWKPATVLIAVWWKSRVTLCDKNVTMSL